MSHIHPAAPSPLDVLELGLQPYQETLALQRRLHSELVAGTRRPTLILCSHPPVITVGKSGNRESVLASDQELASLGIELLEVERGGKVTFHSPDQLIGYPILDLTKKKRDVGWYVRLLEEAIIRTLSSFEVPGIRVEGKTGVWVPYSSDSPLHDSVLPEPRKIASIGVKLSRWCTYHGFALNLGQGTSGFSLIIPCGLVDVKIVSIAELVPTAPKWNEAASVFARHFEELFEYSIERYRNEQHARDRAP